jgi:hypothetical protein
MVRRIDEGQRVIVDATAAYINHLMRAQERRGTASSSSSSSSVIRGNNVSAPVDQNFPSVDYFRTDVPPSISVKAYVERSVAYMRCTPECYVFAAAYLRRIADVGFPVDLNTVHRLFITALVIAAKMRDDHYYSMSYYGQIGGVAARDLGVMELRLLLDVLGFATHVSVQEYKETCAEMGSALSLERREGVVVTTTNSPPAKLSLSTVSSDAGLSSRGNSGATSPAAETAPDAMLCLAWTSEAQVYCPL